MDTTALGLRLQVLVDLKLSGCHSLDIWDHLELDRASLGCVLKRLDLILVTFLQCPGKSVKPGQTVGAAIQRFKQGRRLFGGDTSH